MTSSFSERLRDKLQNGRMRKGGAIRNVLTVLAGTVFAQIVTLAVLPILSRMFSPEHFGMLATFMMLSNNLAMFSTLSYYGAIILPKRDESAFGLLALCMGISTLSFVVISLLVYFFGVEITLLLKSPELAQWLWLLPISVFVWGIFESLATWCTRERQFANISGGVVSRRLGTAAAQLGFGAADFSPGLYIGHVIGEVIGLLFMAWLTLKKGTRRLWKSLRWSRLKILAIRFRRFPKFDLPSSFAAALARNMPVLCLGLFYSPAIVGFFMMAHRLVAGPMQIGASSVTRVFFERANRAKHDGNLPQLTLAVFQKLMLIILTPLCLLCIAAPELIEFLLGKTWQTSGHYLRWITVWLFFSSITSPLHRMFAVLERQNELALLNGLLLVTSLVSLVGGGLYGSDELTIAIFCLSMSLAWMVQCLRVMHISGVVVADIVKTATREVVRAAPYAGTLFALQLASDNTLYISLGFVAVGAVFALTQLRKVLR